MQTRTEKTREKLILSGMELYARFGIEGISLRAVNEHAGSKNNSAAHYHFKTKENFIEHIIRYMFTLEEAEIATFVAQFKDAFSGVEQALFDYVAPIIFIHEVRKWGKFGLQFLAVLLISAQSGKATLWSPEMVQAGDDFIARLSRLLPDANPDELRLRSTFATINFIVGLASEDTISNSVFGDLSADNDEKEIGQLMSLISYCAAGLAGAAK